MVGAIVGRLLLNGRVVAIADQVFTEAELLAAAGQRSFERGVGYTDAVVGMLAVGQQITATVHGTDKYFVMLAPRGRDGLTGACNCPYGREGFFCKHCVAVGLAYLGAQAQAGTGDDAETGEDDHAGRDEASAAGGLTSWLSGLSRDELLLLVLDEVVDNADWSDRLAFRAATAATAAADGGVLASQLASLLDISDFGAYGYVEEGESQRYARRVTTVVEVLDDLVAAGDPGVALILAELALDLVTDACREATDPAGAIWDAVACLAKTHLDACLADPPDQLELAAFLAGRLLTPDVPSISITDYRDLLGVEGLAEVREVLASAVDDDPRSWIASAALEDLLRAAGDTDALVEHLSASLPATGLGHLKIATELAAAGRSGEAVTWAQDALRVSNHLQPGIADFLVRQYLGLDRIDDALRVRRDVFAAAPDLASFQRLREVAERARTWPDTRDWPSTCCAPTLNAHGRASVARCSRRCPRRLSTS